MFSRQKKNYHFIIKKTELSLLYAHNVRRTNGIESIIIIVYTIHYYNIVLTRKQKRI